MRMTIELNKEYVAHQLCEYLNMLAINKGVADDFICYQIDGNTLSICAINDSIKIINVNQAIKDLANALEVLV